MKIKLGVLLGVFAIAAMTDSAAASQCIELDRIVIHDESVNEQEQQKLFLPYLHQCMDGELVKALISDVANHYMSRGYITTRPYLKEQDITDGEIEISVLKGVTESIVEAKSGEPSGRTRSAFAFQTGAQLNLRDIETSLEMFNRPPSVDAKFNIKPGTQAGTSVVEVISEESSPYHLKLGATGQQDMRKDNLQLTAEASIDNPLNINDILLFRYNGSGVQKEYQSNNGYEVNYSFPISSYLFELVWSDFTYRQGVNGFNNTYLSNGDTQGIRGRISKVLMRNQHHKLNLAASVSHKDTKNYFSNQLIAVSSYRTTQVQADLTHTYLQNWGRITSTYSYYQGTDWFGARNDAYVAAIAGAPQPAKLQFVKHSLDIGLLVYVDERRWNLSSNFHLQKSDDLLYDNDKLTVGSDYTVRGYRGQALYGNNAWYVKNDITRTWLPNLYSDFLQSVSLFAGLDYGDVACESDNTTSCGQAAGVAAGFSTQSEGLSTSFVWSRALKKLSNNFIIKDLVKLDLTWSF